ncbi:MAG: PEP-CTERM sorting domain-containing protein [Puniceicoccaceae bacterium]
MKKNLALMTTSLCVLGSALNAAILVDEGFNYSNGILEIVSDGAAVPTGFSDSKWVTGTGIQAIVVQDRTWGSFTNFSGIVNKSISPPSTGEFVAKIGDRALSTPINSDPVSPETYYFSYTFSPDSDFNALNQVGWANWVLRPSGSGTNPAETAVTSANNFLVNWRPDSGKIGLDSGGLNQGDAFSNLALTGGTNYVVVLEVTFAAGADTSKLSVFAEGEDVGAVYSGFQTTESFTATGTLGALSFRMNNQTALGNFRMGTSLADVGVVPEPGTYALLFGFLSLGFVLYRRRRANR